MKSSLALALATLSLARSKVAAADAAERAIENAARLARKAGLDNVERTMSASADIARDAARAAIEAERSLDVPQSARMLAVALDDVRRLQSWVKHSRDNANALSMVERLAEQLKAAADAASSDFLPLRSIPVRKVVG